MTSHVRWLTPDEMRAWLAYLDGSTLLGDFLDQQLRRDEGLVHADYELLARLSAARERTLAMTPLAEALKWTRSRLTRAVVRLERAGLIARREDPADGRGQLAVLTDLGMQLLERAAPGHVAAVRRAVFDVLTPEQVGQLEAIGRAIVTALRTADEQAAYPAALPWERR